MGNMRNSKIFILLMILFCYCEGKDNVSDFEIDDNFDDIASIDMDIGLTFDYFSLENLISDFNLTSKERIAVRFLRSALTDPTIAADMLDVYTFSDDEFYEFLVVLDAFKTKEIIADIVSTLRVRDEILDIIYGLSDKYPKKNNFEVQLAAKEKEYLKILKMSCIGCCSYKEVYRVLKSSDCSAFFTLLKRQIYDTLHEY
ncbi:BTA121 domain-containing protein surface lipoprotein [Borrelia anserina]|uniref:Uncharacterized protein n=2 Tax=Borrelia anserina TaxID=143 RepID=W5SVD6_BORAN|nr:hypothetical protein [Borrelia anserina]AHH08986.1 Hypothetical protein BAN_0022300 [Borrelia anserina BA2]APR65350.1 hypothetical protein N187_A31 [Borrelia anserina Es]